MSEDRATDGCHFDEHPPTAVVEVIDIDTPGPRCPNCGDWVEGIGEPDRPLICKSGCGSFTDSEVTVR